MAVILRWWRFVVRVVVLFIKACHLGKKRAVCPFLLPLQFALVVGFMPAPPKAVIVAVPKGHLAVLSFGAWFVCHAKIDYAHKTKVTG